MKVLPVDLIASVSASSEHANYPADNLLDEHPKKVWKGTASSETLTFTIDAGSNGVAIFNTNATGVTFELLDPNYIIWETGTDWETGVAWSLVEDPLDITQITNLTGSSGSCMAEWAKISSTVVLYVTFAQSSGDVLSAGVAVAGEFLSYSDPKYDGFTEEVIDYSIVSELSNGSVYVKARDTVRKFNVSVLMDTDTDFNEFVSDVARTLKSSPSAWVVTDTNDSRWLAYARLTKMPVGEHFSPDLSLAKFEITEVV